MALSDDQLLDFDASRMPNFDRAKARQTLKGEHADVYRAQLVAARWLDSWLDGVLRASKAPGSSGPEWHAGFEYAMTEIMAHLRQGDFVPGAGVYERTLRGD